MTSEPRYREAPWPVLRNLVEGVLVRHRPHTFYGVMEVDVTEAMNRIAMLRRVHRIVVTLHSYALYCLSRAAVEHPGVLTYRRGNRLITFEDADIATAIDRVFPDGTRMPAIHTVRAAQTKSLGAIALEMRAALRLDQSHNEEVRLRRRAARLPAPMRRLLNRRLERDPFLLQRYQGTIGMTSVGSHGFSHPAYPLPPNIHTYTMALGTVAERVRIEANGRPSTRKILFLASGADHLVVDGMALSRFGLRLTQLLESGDGLDGALAEEVRAGMETYR